MADNFVLANSDVAAAKDIAGVKFARNIITTPAGADLSLLTDQELRAAPVSTAVADVTSAGTLAAAAQTVVLSMAGGMSAAAVQITGTWAGTIQFEGTVDGAVWTPVNGVFAGSSAPGPTITVNGVVRLTPSGLASIRVNATLWTSGTATITMRAGRGTGGVFLNQSLPVGSNVIGKVSIDQATPGTTNLVQVAGHPTATGAATSALSMPVVIASDQASFPVTSTNAVVSGSGTITTQNLVPAGAATAGSAVEITLAGANTLTIQTTGTYTGALSLQVTNDGATWVTMGGVVLLNVNTGGYLATITSALQSLFQADVGGFIKARVTGLSAMTGTATVTLRGVLNPSMVALDASLPAGANVIGGVTGSGTFTTTLPAAAALADGATNPTAPAVYAEGGLFNGTTWDRERGNWNTTTGDTGAKIATGNGATQTNFNAAGAVIVINMGAVTGTTPTLDMKMQLSPDGGTTWVDIAGAAWPQIIATGLYTLAIYPGMTVVASAALSRSLPRTWRLVWTVGGTTPSFTITNVQVAYSN